MKSTRMILLAGAAFAGLAGCNALPSGPQQQTTAAIYSTSGVYVGSGHEEAAETTNASTASDSTTQRGGHGFGSGN
jgi:hypothetical protein